MKKLNPLLLLFTTITMFLTAQACGLAGQTSDSNEYTTITPHQLDRQHISTIIELDDHEALYQRFERHYGDYIGDNPKPVDYDFLMGKQSSLEAFELREWYLRAMEAGLPLQRFNLFGIIQQGNGNYEIDYDDSPHMASISSLFKLAKLPRGGKEHFLLPLGFRQSDIDIMEDYVTNNNLGRLISEATMAYFDQILEEVSHRFAEENGLSDRQLMGEVNAIMYARTYVQYKTTRNWGVGLMRQLDKQRQRILKRVMVERINGVLNGTEHPHNLLESEIITSIRSGAFEQMMMEYRKQRQPQIDVIQQEARQ